MSITINRTEQQRLIDFDSIVKNPVIKQKLLLTYVWLSVAMSPFEAH